MELATSGIPPSRLTAAHAECLPLVSGGGVALARVAGTIRGNRPDLHICRYLAGQSRQHGRVTDVAALRGLLHVQGGSGAVPPVRKNA